MSEYVRSVKVRIEVDTNKQTHLYEDDEADLATLESDIAEWVAGLL